MATNQPQKPTTTTQVHLPRVTIKYFTQCKWMLRAAYVFPPPPLSHTVSYIFSEIILTRTVRPRTPLNIQHGPGRSRPPAGLGGRFHGDYVFIFIIFIFIWRWNPRCRDQGDCSLGSEEGWGVSWYVLFNSPWLSGVCVCVCVCW